MYTNHTFGEHSGCSSSDELFDDCSVSSLESLEEDESSDVLGINMCFVLGDIGESGGMTWGGVGSTGGGKIWAEVLNDDTMRPPPPLAPLLPADDLLPLLPCNT